MADAASGKLVSGHVCPSVRQALEDLFKGTQGATKWTAKANWGASSDPCAPGKVWYGLSCAVSGGIAQVT